MRPTSSQWTSRKGPSHSLTRTPAEGGGGAGSATSVLLLFPILLVAALAGQEGLARLTPDGVEIAASRRGVQLGRLRPEAGGLGAEARRIGPDQRLGLA